MAIGRLQFFLSRYLVALLPSLLQFGNEKPLEMLLRADDLWSNGASLQRIYIKKS